MHSSDTNVNCVRSPLTNEMVTLNDMEEHMRMNLIDPKWKDQKSSMLSKIKETSKASDDEIAFNISNLAKYTTELFGSKHNKVSRDITNKTEKPKTLGINSFNNFNDTLTSYSVEKAKKIITKSQLSEHQSIKVQLINPSDENKKVQMVNVEIRSLNVTIGSLKDRITDIIGLNVTEQKVFLESVGILDDNKSLDFYKVTP